MKTCILTVIKNEHLYLDEWIRYHLDLGIDHIFIFEDIDSESHKNITNKYAENVSLYSILDVLSEGQKHKIIASKYNNLGGGQQVYLQEGLKFIKKQDNYDWCFVIDCDEFITLENQENSLKEIISLYNNYDSFILSWKCYGANGLINMPDYSKKGVLDTYITVINGFVPALSKTHNKKTCYNIKTYRENFWKNNHIPSNDCHYCNTDFVKNADIVTFSKIYIRHYITKSWEEYVWKKLHRKYFYGKSRTLDAFFQINSDMMPLKNKLFSELNEETLIVLPYSQRGSQGSEIRIALKGWRKFCKSPYHFVVIGDFDESLREEFPWVEFIEEPPISKKEGQYNPHLDIQHKMEIAYNLFKDKYKGFVYMVDDNYAIKPFEIYEIKTIHYHELSFIGRKDAPTFWWKHDKWKTRQLMDRENLPHINYTTHFPCYFEFERFKNLWDRFNMREESYVPEDVYFNSYIHEPPVLDSTIRLGIWSYIVFQKEFQNAVKNPNIKFVCNSTEGWSKELEIALWSIIKEEYE